MAVGSRVLYIFRFVLRGVLNIIWMHSHISMCKEVPSFSIFYTVRLRFVFKHFVQNGLL